MLIQKLYKSGNSVVMSIPKQILSELKLKEGSEVAVEINPEEVGFAVKKKVLEDNSSPLTPEFKKWLDEISTKHKKLIQELAKR